jgi:hypothetical protein
VFVVAKGSFHAEELRERLHGWGDSNPREAAAVAKVGFHAEEQAEWLYYQP